MAGRLGEPGQQQRWDDAISFTIDYLYSLHEAAVKPMSSFAHGLWLTAYGLYLDRSDFSSAAISHYSHFDSYVVSAFRRTCSRSG